MDGLANIICYGFFLLSWNLETSLWQYTSIILWFSLLVFLFLCHLGGSLNVDWCNTIIGCSFLIICQQDYLVSFLFLLSLWGSFPKNSVFPFKYKKRKKKKSLYINFVHSFSEFTEFWKCSRCKLKALTPSSRALWSGGNYWHPPW